VLTEVRSVLLNTEVISESYKAATGDEVAVGKYFEGGILEPGMVFVDSTYSNKDKEGNDIILNDYNVVTGEDGKSTLTVTGDSTLNGIAIWYADDNGTLYYGNPDYRSGYVKIPEYGIIGPNNELYLDQGQAVAFCVEVKAPSGYKLRSFDVGVKSIAPSSGEAVGVPFTSPAMMNVLLTNSAGSNAKAIEFAKITSATAQNYDLMKLNKSLDDGKAYVVITNTGEGVLSITDIKAAFAPEDEKVTAFYSSQYANEPDPEDASVEFTVDSETLALAYRALNND